MLTLTFRHIDFLPQSSDQGASVFLQPLSAHRIVRHNTSHLSPEASRMIEFFPVAQLMHSRICGAINGLYDMLIGSLCSNNKQL